MMCQCVFYTTCYKEELLQRFKELQEENETINLFELTPIGDIYRFGYATGDSTIDTIETFAHIISDIVQKIGIMQIVKEYLRQRKDLLLSDKKEIEKSFVTYNYLSTQEGFSALTYYLVYMPLLAVLKEDQEINIDGWLRFRSYKYKMILEDILEQFIEDYLIKKDIVKFIKMVREMRNLNNPLEDILHLVYTNNGEMNILNEKMEDVTALYIKQYCKELLADSTLNKEDLMMHIFITVSPRRITVHQHQKSKQPQFIKTLEGIFGINIKYCKGCKYCTDNTNTART